MAHHGGGAKLHSRPPSLIFGYDEVDTYVSKAWKNKTKQNKKQCYTIPSGPKLLSRYSPRIEFELLSRQLIATCSFSTSTPSPRLDGGESSRFPKLVPPP